MYRTFRLRGLARRPREVALGLAIASSATLIVAAVGHRARRPLLADSAQRPDSSAWDSTPRVVAHNANRTSSDSSPRKVRVPESLDSSHTPPPQTKGHSTFDAEGDLPHDSPVSAWRDATDRLAAACDSIAGFDLPLLRSKITDALLPSWMRLVPRYLEKLNNELSAAPHSLSWEIWQDAHDPEVNPEILWDARVRISRDLCPDERSFLRRRRDHTARALARYLDVPESEVHPEDVPVIAVCGSGGGLRALVAGASSYLSTQEAGLFDCVTYTAGVSGSCWLQSLYYSSLTRQSHAQLLDHLKNRIGVHIAYPPAALGLLSQAPTNKFLLSGFVEKLRGVPDADFGLVDVYGLLLAARLLVPKGELDVSDRDLKISNQRSLIDDGEHPLPIYTAVRHEIPGHLKADIEPSKLAWHNTKHFDWFQWFEWTPYEFFCEELECGIPTWAVGRKWDCGNGVWRENGLALPELRVPLMMGIWGSAFCATLSHYYKEIRPILMAGGLNKLDSVLSGKDQDLSKVHPIDPAVIPNFAVGLRDRLPSSVPDSLLQSSHLQLMDAGMSNNLPIYPLLRPGREVDVVVAFDASADVKTDNWIKVVDGYVRQRGVKGWPMGAGWPTPSQDHQRTVQHLAGTQSADAEKITDSLEHPTGAATEPEPDLGFCTVWVGSSQPGREFMDEGPTHRLRADGTDDDQLTRPDAGIALIYFPFLANPAVPDVDPASSDFMSTWNFIYSPPQIDQVIALARANFDQGREQTRRTIRAVWMRKRTARLEREREQREHSRSGLMRRNGDQFGG